mmetsp:Transcript_66723/g.143965  ORF Transcript_66723/g.143965 Transcript_66723/m.143965 type:complete len:94 (-) Transcript_66723:769-1050(-)
MSIDPLSLEIKLKSKSANDRMVARALTPLRKQHHLCMVSLLIAQCLAAESLPLFLDAITNPLAAVIISVVLSLFFGEILPNSYATGPKKLQVV